MFFKICNILCWFLIFKLTSCIDLTEKLRTSLEDILQFAIKTDHIIDINLLFGAAIVSGQLSVIGQYYRDAESQFQIFRLQQLSEQIFQIGFSKEKINEEFEPAQYALMSTELWAFDNPPQHLNESMLLHLSQHVAKTSYSENDVVFRQSYDYCLKNLMNQCFIPNKCLRLIDDYDRGGYIITHQILYLHIARQLLHMKMCQTSGSFDETFINWQIGKKCCNVFLELEDIEKRAKQNQTFLDLLFEEVVVCGLQNYVEFFKPQYLHYIMNYQFPRDYEYIPESNSFAHLISVRMASIVLFLKNIIQLNQYSESNLVLTTSDRHPF